MAAATATTETTEKWIGFDMDECMAQLGVLYYFLAGLPAESPDIMASVISQFARKEKKGATWILRPAFCELLPFLGSEFKKGTLKGVILYSNNGSQRMVEFVGDLMEAIAGEKMVVARLSAEWPEVRKGAALSKNIEFLQKHVSSSIGLGNLLFFDDLPDHALSYQLAEGNYIQVAPYNNQIDVEYLKDLFRDFTTSYTNYEKYKLIERAERAEARDKESGKLFEPMDERASRAEKIEFRGIFMRFLGLTSGGTRRTRRRRVAGRKIGAHSRKCRRLRPSRSRTQ